MPQRVADDQRLTFIEHLDELRRRLIFCVGALAFGFLLGYILAPWALRILLWPLEKAGFALSEKAVAKTPSLMIRVGADGVLRLEGGAEAFARAAKEIGRRPTRMVIMREKEETANASATPGAGANPAASADSTKSTASAAPAEEERIIIGAPPLPSVIYLRPMDPFFIILKIALILGVVFAAPFIAWQLWLFIAPGLTQRERRWAVPVILSASLLFPIGMAFAYSMLSLAIRFFAQYAVEGLSQQLDIRAYLGFALTTLVSFGIVFELPVALLLATRMGLISVAMLRRRRREVFLILLVLSAILTPTGDPFTLMALTLPLYALFEMSIFVSRWMEHSAHSEPENAPSDDTLAGA